VAVPGLSVQMMKWGVPLKGSRRKSRSFT